MKTAPAAPADAPAQAIDDRYQCDEMAVRVTHRGDGPVTLEFQATKLTLPRVISASGARFADEQGNEFWSKGGGAILNLTGQTMRNCVPASASAAESTAPSPY